MAFRFLRPEDISKLQSFEFAPKAVAEGYLAGKRNSRHAGSSVEFRDHRPYTSGDDIQRVDWRVFARTERHYVKTFEMETNTDCHIMLDSSASMGFGENPSKLEYASFFAASLVYLVTRGHDAVSMHLFDAGIREGFPPGSSPKHVDTLLHALERNTPGSETRLSHALRDASPLLKRKGILVIISDFLDDAAEVFAGLNPYLHRGYQIYLYHLCDPAELQLAGSGLQRFVDMETGERLDAHADEVRRAYREALEGHQRSLRELAVRRRVRYRFVTTDTPFFELFDDFVR